MRNCPYCAESVQDAAILCKHCGKDIPEPPADAPRSLFVQAELARPKSSRSRVAWLVATAVVLAIILIGTSGGARANGYSAQPPSFPRRGQTISIANEAATDIAAGQYVTWQWQAIAGLRSCHLQGRILGLAGGGKDVDVIVFDEDNFLNWKNGHPSKVYFESGKQTATTLDLQLDSSRKYELVVSNAFSAFTSKTVQLENLSAICTE